MKFLKLGIVFVLVLFVSSCKEDEMGIEQFYENRDAGIAYLDANKSKDGVVVAESGSGLQYKVLTEGEGVTVKQYDPVKVKLKYTDIEGRVIGDNTSLSLDDLALYNVDELLLGLSEGIKYMNVGSKYMFYLPYQLAFGAVYFDNIDPFSAIIFEVELMQIGNEGTLFLEENLENEGVFVTDSGLQYKVLKEADGANPGADSTVDVKYTGKLIDDTIFDSNDSATFNLETLIPGFTEGVQLMEVGEIYEFYIPYYLGYGSNASSSIPSFSTIIFEVELLGVE